MPNLILIVHWNTVLQSDLDAVEVHLLFLISEMKSLLVFTLLEATIKQNPNPML